MLRIPRAWQGPAGFRLLAVIFRAGDQRCNDGQNALPVHAAGQRGTRRARRTACGADGISTCHAAILARKRVAPMLLCTLRVYIRPVSTHAHRGRRRDMGIGQRAEARYERRSPTPASSEPAVVTGTDPAVSGSSVPQKNAGYEGCVRMNEIDLNQPFSFGPPAHHRFGRTDTEQQVPCVEHKVRHRSGQTGSWTRVRDVSPSAWPRRSSPRCCDGRAGERPAPVVSVASRHLSGPDSRSWLAIRDNPIPSPSRRTHASPPSHSAADDAASGNPATAEANGVLSASRH